MNTHRLDQLIRWRSLQSLLLILGLSINLTGLGWLLGGPLFAVLLASSILIAYLISPSVSPELILRFYRGRLIPRHQAPNVYKVLAELSRRAGLDKTPELYYLPSPVPNALTIGGGPRSGIALSDGLLHQLNMLELTAVLAHEISHLNNRDLRRNTFAAISVRFTQSLQMIGILLFLIFLPLLLMGTWQVSWALVGALILAPIFGNLMIIFLSRVHEYQADLQAVQLTGNPLALIGALKKLGLPSPLTWKSRILPQEPADKLRGLFSTHPPTAKRIKYLLEIVPSQAQCIGSNPYLPANCSCALPDTRFCIIGAA